MKDFAFILKFARRLNETATTFDVKERELELMLAGPRKDLIEMKVELIRREAGVSILQPIIITILVKLAHQV